MRTKKMVRHSKRHSRKRGSKSGKRSRGRRQYGGWWSSLITADANVVYELGNPTRQKGIDIKYQGSGPNRQWLIGGDDKTVGELLGGAKEGRYIDVIQAIRSMRGGPDSTLSDDQKGIILNDDEFCGLFVRNLNTEHKPLADKYRLIKTELSRQPYVFHSMLQPGTPAVDSSMFNPVRPSHASVVPAAMLETYFSDKFAKGLRR